VDNTKPYQANRRDVRRAAYAGRLWLTDVLQLRFGNYHWESRRRLMQRYDQRRRAR
jgi:hypothetical protein